jgi:hypothetical protein
MSFLSMIYRRRLRATAAVEAEQPEPETPPTPQREPAARPAVAAPAAAPSRIDADEIAGLCIASGVPLMTAVLVKAGINDAEQVRARVEGAAEIKAMFARAAKTNDMISPAVADVLNADGISVETARTVLNHLLVIHQSPEINTALRADDRPRDGGWDDVIAKAAKKS